MIKRLIIFIVEYIIVTAGIVGACIAFTLHDKGMAYAHTLDFRQDLHMMVKVSLVAAGLIFFVLVCYRLTRRTLQNEPRDPENFFWS